MGRRYAIYSRTRTKNGKTYKTWRLDCGIVDGKRKIVERSTRKKVEALRDKYIDGEKDIGEHVFDLTETDLRMTVQAKEILGSSATIIDAANYYVEHHPHTGNVITVDEMLEDYVQSRIDANRRPASVHFVRDKVGRFAETFGERPLYKITTSDIISWMNKQGYQKGTRKSYRTALNGFFNYAISMKHISHNPVIALPVPTVDQGDIRVFTVEDVKALLSKAIELHPDLVPYFALGIFAGLRPVNEIQNLMWADVDLKTGRIRVRPETAKKRRQRFVDISPNLVKWLAPYKPKRNSKIIFSRRRYETVREKSNVSWDSDIMRHTYASYHLAQHENAAATSLQMGHMGTDILFNHYRDLVTREDAEKFWGIEPKVKKNGNIIQLRQTA